MIINKSSINNSMIIGGLMIPILVEDLQPNYRQKNTTGCDVHIGLVLVRIRAHPAN